MLQTKFKNQQIEQKITSAEIFQIFQFQFRYQVIIEYVTIKTTEAILYSARWLSSVLPSCANLHVRVRFPLANLFFQCRQTFFFLC